MPSRNVRWNRACLGAVAVLGLCAGTVLAGQAPQQEYASVGVSPDAKPLSLTGEVMNLKDIDVVQTGLLDYAAAAAESAQRTQLGMPLRFAIPVDADYTPENSGSWEALKDGMVLWRLRVSAPDALTMNLGFTEFALPKGGSMTLLTTDGREVMRPFTHEDNKDHGQLWTPVLNTDELVIEVVVPDKTVQDVRLRLGAINAGFRRFGVSDGAVDADRGVSGSCNVDVACPEGNPWTDQIAAAGAYTVSGIDTCSGSMVNNTAQDRTPYFLTAFHCGVGAGQAPSVVIYWNFQNSTCRPPGSPASGGAGDGSLAQFSSGTTFRAGFGTSDVTLLQVNTAPDPSWGVTFAGWSREGFYPPSGACIHHPAVAEKRISFYDIAVRPTRPSHGSSWGCSAFPGPGDESHISVYWSLGVTEGGSSGSPLYDNNKRIIGQLHGGPSSCSQSGDGLSDCYGRFFRSWTGGGTSATRLSDWLDPGATGALVVDTLGKGLDVSPATGTTHSGLTGGPFSPASVVYTLGNTTPVSINYTVSIVGGGTAPILLNGGPGPLGGSIAASGSTPVTVSVDQAAAAVLSAGVYATTVRFEDTTNGVVITRLHTIEVGLTNFTTTPGTGLASGGPVGGPFSATQAYTITSTQPSPVNISVSADQPWISLNGVSGPLNLNLNGVGDSTIVTVGYGAAATALGAGLYNGTVSFTNLSGGTGSTTRPVALDVGRYIFTYPGPPIAIPDNNATGITSTINVPNAFCVGDVDVDVRITHTFIGDLVVELTSPTGTVVRLHNRTGGSADNIFRLYDQGVLNPDGPGSLNDFNGLPALGTWTLSVRDLAGTDIGTLDFWQLRIAQSGVACPPLAQAQSVSVPDSFQTPITLQAVSTTGAPLVYTIKSLPANGTLRDPGDNAPITSVPYTLIGGGNIVKYRPAALFVGPDSFAFSATDSTESPNATVSVLVGNRSTQVAWNMDANPGWTLGTGWAYGVPQGLSGDPSSGFTGANVVGFNLAGDYTNSLPAAYATTPAINLTGRFFTRLDFRRWLGVESSTFDRATVEISNNGTTWTTIFLNPTVSINESAWSFHTFDVSAVADNQATFYVRWGLGPTDGSVVFHGWNIDDVVVSAVAPPLTPPFCPGDANADGLVNFADVTSVLTNFGSNYGQLGQPGDANGDFTVSFADVTSVLTNFGTKCP